MGGVTDVLRPLQHYFVGVIPRQARLRRHLLLHLLPEELQELALQRAFILNRCALLRRSSNGLTQRRTNLAFGGGGADLLQLFDRDTERITVRRAGYDCTVFANGAQDIDRSGSTCARRKNLYRLQSRDISHLGALPRSQSRIDALDRPAERNATQRTGKTGFKRLQQSSLGSRVSASGGLLNNVLQDFSACFLAACTQHLLGCTDDTRLERVLECFSTYPGSRAADTANHIKCRGGRGARHCEADIIDAFGILPLANARIRLRCGKPHDRHGSGRVARKQARQDSAARNRNAFRHSLGNGSRCAGQTSLCILLLHGACSARRYSAGYTCTCFPDRFSSGGDKLLPRLFLRLLQRVRGENTLCYACRRHIVDDSGQLFQWPGNASNQSASAAHNGAT